MQHLPLLFMFGYLNFAAAIILTPQQIEIKKDSQHTPNA